MVDERIAEAINAMIRSDDPMMLSLELEIMALYKSQSDQTPNDAMNPFAMSDHRSS